MARFTASEAKRQGWDEQWVDPPDKDLECVICKLICYQAVAHACGHLFCVTCLRQWREQGKPCPTCRAASEAHPAHRDRRTILNLEVVCPKECEAKLRLGDLRKHQEDECIHRNILCESCQATCTVSTRDHHQKNVCKYRVIKCELCQDPCTPITLEEHKRTSCTQRAVPCDHCSARVKLVDMDQHLTDNLASHLGPHLRGMSKRIIALEGMSKRIIALESENVALSNRIKSLERPAPQLPPVPAPQLQPYQIQQQVMEVFRADQTEAGLTIGAAALMLSHIPALEIRRAVWFLSDEGHLYSTIDEEHYKFQNNID